MKLILTHFYRNGKMNERVTSMKDSNCVNVFFFFWNYSISLSDPPIEGLFSGCALGILHDDKQMAKLVIDELKQHESNSTVVHHIAFLTSQFYLKMVIECADWVSVVKKKTKFWIISTGTDEKGFVLSLIYRTYPSGQYVVEECFGQLFTFKLQKVAQIFDWR